MRLDLIHSDLLKLLAVETLEYHDKNWLAGDNKTRCEMKQELLRCCIKEIEKQSDCVDKIEKFKEHKAPKSPL